MAFRSTFLLPKAPGIPKCCSNTSVQKSHNKKEGGTSKKTHKTVVCEFFGAYPTKSCSYFYYKNLVLQKYFYILLPISLLIPTNWWWFYGCKVSSLKHGVQGFRDIAQSVHCLGWITRISFLSLETMSKIENTNNTKRVLLHASVITELSNRRQQNPWGLQVKLHGKFQGTRVTHNSL